MLLKDRLICAQCNTSGRVRYRRKTRDYVCDRCGHTWKADGDSSGDQQEAQ